MKLIYVKNAENAYTKQLQEMRQLPSASKQYKLWLSALEEGNETQRLFANCINVAGTLVIVKNIISGATNRYANGYDETKAKRIISFVYLFQSAQKELKRIMYNDGMIEATPEQKAVRDAYAKYMRAALTFKQGGQIYTAKYESEQTPDQTPEQTPEK